MSFNKENRTPLNLLACSDHGSDGEKKVIKEVFIKAGLSQVSRNAITTVSEKRTKKKTAKALASDDKEKASTNSDDNTLVVAALVATVTFTAGITVPGGYNGNEGPNLGAAMLLKSAAFQVFVVADTLAFLLSTLALVLYFVYHGSGEQERLKIPYKISSKITTYSVLAMVMAFITGTYSVLSSLPSLAIPLCVITSYFFATVFVQSIRKQLD